MQYQGKSEAWGSGYEFATGRDIFAVRHWLWLMCRAESTLAYLYRLASLSYVGEWKDTIIDEHLVALYQWGRWMTRAQRLSNAKLFKAFLTGVWTPSAAGENGFTLWGWNVLLAFLSFSFATLRFQTSGRRGLFLGDCGLGELPLVELPLPVTLTAREREAWTDTPLRPACEVISMSQLCSVTCWAISASSDKEPERYKRAVGRRMKHHEERSWSWSHELNVKIIIHMT